MTASLLEQLADLPKTEVDALIRAMAPGEANAFEYDWRYRARPEQLPPTGSWRIWLLLAGRGFGKTRCGAEWVRAEVKAGRRRIAQRRLFAEDRTQDKIADQRVDLGSAARELGREGPRQRHRGHGFAGPRVGDRLANPVLRYSHSLHQLNLTALVRGRLKLRLPAAPLLAHGSLLVAKIKIYGAFDILSIELQSSGVHAIRDCRHTDRV